MYVPVMVISIRDIIFRLKKLLLLYSCMLNSSENNEYLIFQNSIEYHDFNGVICKQLVFIDMDGAERRLNNLYTHPLHLMKGIKYTVTSLYNVIVKINIKDEV